MCFWLTKGSLWDGESVRSAVWRGSCARGVRRVAFSVKLYNCVIKCLNLLTKKPPPKNCHPTRSNILTTALRERCDVGMISIYPVLGRNLNKHDARERRFENKNERGFAQTSLRSPLFNAFDGHINVFCELARNEHTYLPLPASKADQEIDSHILYPRVSFSGKFSFNINGNYVPLSGTSIRRLPFETKT